MRVEQSELEFAHKARARPRVPPADRANRQPVIKLRMRIALGQARAVKIETARNAASASAESSNPAVRSLSGFDVNSPDAPAARAPLARRELPALQQRRRALSPPRTRPRWRHGRASEARHGARLAMRLQRQHDPSSSSSYTQLSFRQLEAISRKREAPRPSASAAHMQNRCTRRSKSVSSSLRAPGRWP